MIVIAVPNLDVPNTFLFNMSRRRTGQVQVSGNYRQLEVRLMELGGQFLVGMQKVWRCFFICFHIQEHGEPDAWIGVRVVMDGNLIL